uniref:Carbohydrate kinase family protein n=1 Tax=Ignisphaera aggregans TaxID=334771 RepID=A0A7C2VHM7_9CREN
MPIYIAGRINIDHIIEIEGVIARGRKYRGKIIEVDVGGTASNIATAIARMRWDLKPVLLGAIGRDFQDYVFGRLAPEGIDLRFLKVLEADTGKAYVFVDPEGEPTIVTIPGANDLYSEEHVPPIDDAVALVLGNTTFSVACKILSMKPKSALLFMDPHSLWAEIQDYVASIGGQCFYLPNETELFLYSNVDVNDVESLKRYAERIGCSIIVKRGSRGVVALHKGVLIRAGAIALESMGLRVVSTAGCGDVFTGVFVAMYTKSGDIVEALKYSLVAAALKASRISPRASPTIDELDYYIEHLEKKNLINLEIKEAKM